MTEARCSCGALALKLVGQPVASVVCHCLECQRRTGSAFGAGLFYPEATVETFGVSKVYSRVADSGGSVHNHFCEVCGSTVFWKADNLPGFVGVALGALDDSVGFVPGRSIFEYRRHAWVEIDVAGLRFPRSGGVPKTD